MRCKVCGGERFYEPISKAFPCRCLNCSALHWRTEYPEPDGTVESQCPVTINDLLWLWDGTDAPAELP